jgi:DivIVA domain-containing protein
VCPEIGVGMADSVARWDSRDGAPGREFGWQGRFLTRVRATIAGMAQVLLLLVVALTVGAVVFGVMVLVSGGDPGMAGVEPDGRGRPLPGSRPLVEQDVAKVTFDVALRGYRMDQVDRALKRVAYDIGYKDELINVLAAEVEALRDGRVEDADALRAARLAASNEPETPVEPQLVDGTVTESGPSISEPAPEIDFDEVPDGPFAPWPTPEATDKAEDEPADEADHPTDTPEPEQKQKQKQKTEPEDSDADRVVTRG